MNIPSFAQPQVSGKVSWFGGPHDPSSGPTTASGASVREPGIAVYNRSTLGGYWKVTAPNGRTAVLRQTDLGPAPFTGRKVDVTYSALGQLGYNEGNFPTDSVVKASYLGKNRPASAAQVQTQQTQATRGGAVEGLGFNKLGYQAAVQHAAGERAAASLFNEPGDSVLRGALEQAGTPPSAASFGTKVGAEHTVIKTAGATPGEAGPTFGVNSQYVNPHLGATQERTDQGVDFSMAPGTPIRAIGDAKVLGVSPNWFKGQPYVYYRLESGPAKGKVIYVAEQITPAVKAGDVVKAGQAIGHYAPAGTGIEEGFSTAGGQTQAMATTGYREGEKTKAGEEYARFYKGLK
jgi:murein DD-endopeptidase MepM/ murein hydrolase activator NlpD